MGEATGGHLLPKGETVNVANILETWKEASRLEQDLREALLDLREEGKRTAPTTEWREAVSKDKRPAVRVLFKEWARAEADLEQFLAHPVVFDSSETLPAAMGAALLSHETRARELIAAAENVVQAHRRGMRSSDTMEAVRALDNLLATWPGFTLHKDPTP